MMQVMLHAHALVFIVCIFIFCKQSSTKPCISEKDSRVHTRQLLCGSGLNSALVQGGSGCLQLGPTCVKVHPAMSL